VTAIIISIVILKPNTEMATSIYEKVTKTNYPKTSFFPGCYSANSINL